MNKMYEEHRGKLRERRRQDVKDQVRTVKYITNIHHRNF